jgi:hypothetical protein
MMYVDFSAGGKDYKLRLNTRNLIALEKQIGMSPLAIFDGETLPTITVMVSVLWASLQQLNHGIGMNEAYDIFDDYLADGHDVMEFYMLILDIYKVSGLMKDNSSKN